MLFWVLNGYAHLDPFYGILLNFGCSFQSMVPNTHCKRWGLQPGSLSLISSHRMENILNRSSHGVIAQLHFIQMQPWTVSTTPLDLSFRCTLQMPDFSKLFTLESDAYDNGLGVVLFQDEHPIAFTDKFLSRKNLSTSTYEKEMMTILHTVHKWWPSLLENPFGIKIDH